MKLAFMAIGTLLALNVSASEGQLGASLKIKDTNISLGLSCLERAADQKCLTAQLETNYCPEDNDYKVRLSTEDLNRIEKASKAIKQSMLKARYLKAGVIVSESVGHKMDEVFGEEKDLGEMAISIVPIVAGATVDVIKSPAVYTTYVIASTRANLAIEKELRNLVDESKRGDELEVSKEDLVSIFNAIRDTSK